MEIRHKDVFLSFSMHEVQPIDIHKRLVNVYGCETVDVSTVRRWVRRFQRGDRDVSDNLALAAQAATNKMKHALISSSNPTGGQQ